MRIFRNAKEVGQEECNFGCKHHVVYNEIADVEEVLAVKKDIFYGTDRVGSGYDVFYRDYFGDLYLSEGDWTGNSFILQDTADRFWYRGRPQGFDANKTLDGSPLNFRGELI